MGGSRPSRPSRSPAPASRGAAQGPMSPRAGRSSGVGSGDPLPPAAAAPAIESPRPPAGPDPAPAPPAAPAPAPTPAVAAPSLPEGRRPTWDEYFIAMAELAATRSTCPRRQVGAVLVHSNRVIATGYNGAVRGAPHCSDAGCLVVDGHCVRAVHAELNAILQCAVTGVSSAGCTLVTTSFPCVACAKAAVQAGIVSVIYLSTYPDPNSAEVLRAGGVRLHRAVRDPDGAYRVRAEA